MTRNVLLAWAFMICSIPLFSQGVNFRDLSFQQALKKAKSENKLVFVDAYAVWCGPCKVMNEEVFSQKEAGDFFNKHFVNLKLDMEKGEGLEVMKSYAINVYPTFMLISPEGVEQFRRVGGAGMEQFIASVKTGMEPINFLSTFESEYRNGNMNKARLLEYIRAVTNAHKFVRAKEVYATASRVFKTEEKLSPGFWASFSDTRVNPVDVNDLIFVTENYDQLINNNGKTEVDTYLSTAYTISFRPFISGDTNDPLAETNIALLSMSTLDSIREVLQKGRFPEKDYYLLRAQLAKAAFSKDAEGLFSLIGSNIDQFTLKSAWLLGSAFHRFDKNDKALMARIVALGEKLAEGPYQFAVKSDLKQSFQDYQRFADTSVYFSNYTLSEALRIAGQKKLLVFVDCYTTWCGPCKTMSEKVFPRKLAGDYFNERFINIKIDMEKQKGPEIAKKYDVHAYPTFLVLRPDGSLQHKIVGSRMDPAWIINEVEKGFAEKQATGYQDKLYKEGNRSKEFLGTYLTHLISLSEMDKAKAVSHELLAQLSNEEKVSPAYWSIFSHPGISDLFSENFNYVVKNKELFSKSNTSVLVDRYLTSTVTDKLLAVYVTATNRLMRSLGDPISSEQIVRLKKEFPSFGIPGQEEIFAMADITQAFLGKDAGQIMQVTTKNINKINSKNLPFIAIGIMEYIKTAVHKNQEVQYKEFVEMLINSVDNSRVKDLIRSMAF